MLTEITHREIAPHTVVITLTGRLTIGTRGERIESLVESLLAEGKRIIIFDLAGLAAIDSTGIGHFIASYGKITAAGGDMRMACATGRLFEAFHVSLLDKVFRFCPTVEEASRA